MMATWTRQPQEQSEDYFFSGQFLVTRGVNEELSKEEIFGIYQDVQAFVKEQIGVDYIQIYLDENGRKLFFIDQLSKGMIESGDYAEEHNYCTLMFAHEY